MKYHHCKGRVNASKLKEIIMKRRALWRKEHQTLYIQGILFGLRDAEFAVDEALQYEESERKRIGNLER